MNIPPTKAARIIKDIEDITASWISKLSNGEPISREEMLYTLKCIRRDVVAKTNK